MRRSATLSKILGAMLLAASLSTAVGRPLACPPEMAPIAGMSACIDRWEASLTGGEAGGPDGKTTTARAASRDGAAPATKISQLQARAACDRAGKRLCTVEEWQAACRGPGGARKYSYGAKYIPARCHDRSLKLRRHSERPLPTGSLPACRTPEGVYDLSGNVWEWLASPRPDVETAALIGGGYGNDDDDDNLSCSPEDPIAQPLAQQIDGVGFRCCRSLP